MITLHYTLTKEDYVNFYLQVMWRSPEKRKRLIKNYIVKALLYTGLLVFIKLSYNEDLLDTYFVFSVAIILLLFIMPIFRMAELYKKQVERTLKNPLNANFFRATQVIFSDTGIFTKNEFTETTYQWKGIVKKEENKEYYFLYINSEHAILIPKRALTIASDKPALEKLFAEHISFNAEVGHLLKE
jgi:hypothetical protein